MKRNQQIILLSLLTIVFYSCSVEQNERESELDDPEINHETERSEERDRIVDYNETVAVVDTQAMNQVTNYLDLAENATIWEKYDQSENEYDNWCDKLWGRCCTEADMRFTEKLFYNISTSHDYKAYPFENAFDGFYNTAYVFEAKDSIVITIQLDNNSDYVLGFNKTPFEKLSKTDRIHDRFKISLINGYTKSEKTFKENARMKKAELWLNGLHRCNVKFLDTPEIQMIEANFPFFKFDEVKLIPYEFYKGTKYDDVCISAIQGNLGYGANPALDVKFED